MKHRRFSWISILLVAAFLITGLGGPLSQVFAAAPTTYQLSDLLSNDQIKPMGRTVVLGEGITTEWTGTGFEANLVVEEACDLTVGYHTSYNQYYSITVDGVKTRLYAPKGVGTFSVPVTAGERNVRVVVETQNAFTIDSYSNLTTLTFAGTLGARPADKDLFIEFVGDSYTCGDGSMGTYVPGENWSFPADDASTEGFAYKTAQLLDADYSLVARGGIGLFGESAEAQQETDSKLTMAQVYDYDGAHRDYLKVQDGQAVTPHDFSARTPDVIVVELGANDGISHMDLWLERATDFINQLRDRNGPDPVIVWFTLRPQFYQAVDNLFRTTFVDDPNLRVFRYTATAGTGSAAKKTQYSGHPSAEDGTFTAQATAAFLEREALPVRTEETAYTDTVYYVSENGSSTNDGLTYATALDGVPAVFTKIYNASTAAGTTSGNVNRRSLPAGTRVIIYVEGSVTGSASQAFCRADVFVDAATGKQVPIVIEGYDNTRARLRMTYGGNTDGNSCFYSNNKITFRNIEFYGVTKQTSNKYYCVHRVYAGIGGDLTFDNCQFHTDGDVNALNSHQWTLSADFFSGSSYDGTGEVTDRITLMNGDYTDLALLTTVSANNLYKSGGSYTNAPGMTSELVIGEGAVVGTVYNRSGALNVGNSTVILDGGTIGTYIGTANGTEDAPKAIIGNVNFVLKSGVYTGNFVGTGTYNAIDGDVTYTQTGGELVCNTFHGMGEGTSAANTRFTLTAGQIRCTPLSSNTGVYLTGASKIKVTNTAHNLITGGAINLFSEGDGANGGVWFGGGNLNDGTFAIKTQINEVTGGAVQFLRLSGTSTATGIYFGSSSGGAEKLVNRITGGVFDVTLLTKSIYFGSQSTSGYYGSIENYIGVEGAQQTHIPAFKASNVYLGAAWNQLGSSGSKATAFPEEGVYETVVQKNVIYTGYFGGKTYFTTGSLSGSYISFTKGSVENTVYNGAFQGEVYFGSGAASVYGNVTTTVNGGRFGNGSSGNVGSVYGGAESGKVYGDVTTVVNGFSDYANTYNAVRGVMPPWGFYGGSKTGEILGDVTTTVNGGTFTIPFYGGSNEGDIAGHVTTTVNNLTGRMFQVYGGSNTGSLANGVETLITGLKSNGSEKSVYGGSNTGAIEKGSADYAVKLTVQPVTHSDKYDTGDVAIDGDVFAAGCAGNVTGGVYAAIYGGNNCQSSGAARQLILGNQEGGLIDGSVSCDLYGGFFGSSVYTGTRDNNSEDVGVTGNVTLTLLTGGNTSHIGSVYTRTGTLGTQKVVFDNTASGSTIVNNNVVADDSLHVKVIGGAGQFSVTGNTNIRADEADVTAGPVRFYKTTVNFVHGKVYLALPETVSASDVVVTKKSGLTGSGLVYANTGCETKVFGFTGTQIPGNTLILQDRISTRFYFEKAAIDTILTNVGDWNYSYTYDGETVTGAITASSPYRAADDELAFDCYFIDVPVDAASLDETIAFTYYGGTNSTSVNDLLRTVAEDDGTNFDAGFITLAKTIWNYGVQAKAVFTGEALSADLYDDVPYTEPASVFSYQPSGVSQARYVGTNLKLKDQIQIQIFMKFDSEEDMAKTAFSLDGGTTTLSPDAYSLAVLDTPVPGLDANAVFALRLNANQMKETYSVTAVYDGTPADSFTTSVASFCKIYMEDAANGPVYGDLCRAILSYADACDAYFN